MKTETKGTVVNVSTQWWLKLNTKAVRTQGPLDGAEFPHVIRVTYTVDGVEYTKRKWIGAGSRAPVKGSTVTVVYDEEAPAKAEIICEAAGPRLENR